LSESIKTFKIFATSTIVYSVYIIISQIVNLVQTYFNIGDNPLIPKYLLKYIGVGEGIDDLQVFNKYEFAALD